MALSIPTVLVRAGPPIELAHAPAERRFLERRLAEL